MKKILMVVTSHKTLGDPTRETGLWLSEFTKFYHKVKDRFSVDVVSPSGKEVPIDPRSLSELLLSKNLRNYYNDDTFMDWLRNPFAPDQVEADHYEAVYFAGGHGTMWDFPSNAELQEITRTIYEKGGIVSAVCHGPSALCNLKLSNGSYLVEGKSVTGYSNREETAIMLYKYLPFSLEDKLKDRGAMYEQSRIPFRSFVQKDGRLVTGQNPASVEAVAKKVIALLRQSD
ncbi:type 1 glutamine amidotransferase domain-containing protein [Sediminibacillus albus]|uniref:Putative intracellular protease/amidase n=1 Tax=Sediminibacillus albus TaxID=407036 RepID=A0A1G9AK37_9BACI|nr:type 1 glutamine amidotransferase domain-containing protein [Sediminibacillus albus]SDK27613.1 Putative intracellular protease/amidase [Sediminibacillus albus]